MTFKEELAALTTEQQEHVEASATVALALQFSNDAVKASRDAEANLLAANGRWLRLSEDRFQFLAMPPSERLAMLDGVGERTFLHELQQLIEDAQEAVVRLTILAAQALHFVLRTTTTLEQAIQLHVMGR